MSLFHGPVDLWRNEAPDWVQTPWWQNTAPGLTQEEQVLLEPAPEEKKEVSTVQEVAELPVPQQDDLRYQQGKVPPNPAQQCYYVMNITRRCVCLAA